MRNTYYLDPSQYLFSFLSYVHLKAANGVSFSGKSFVSPTVELYLLVTTLGWINTAVFRKITYLPTSHLIRIYFPENWSLISPNGCIGALSCWFEGKPATCNSFSFHLRIFIWLCCWYNQSQKKCRTAFEPFLIFIFSVICKNLMQNTHALCLKHVWDKNVKITTKALHEVC